MVNLARKPLEDPRDELPIARRGEGEERIGAAIEAGAGSVDAVSEATGAGSSCGSCRPEIVRIIAQTQSKKVRHAA